MAKASRKAKDTLVSLTTDVNKLYEIKMKGEMIENGMKTSYRHLLKPLAIKDGVTQLELVKYTRLKAPTVSTTLRNMEADGLVERETDKDDARATRVYLTDKGRDVDKKMRASTTKIEKMFMTDISSEDAEKVMEILKKMKSNMESIVGYSINE